jgi:hypothetical protein
VSNKARACLCLFDWFVCLLLFLFVCLFVCLFVRSFFCSFIRGSLDATTTHFYPHRIGKIVKKHINAKYASILKRLFSEVLECAFKYVWLELSCYILTVFLCY